METQIAIVLSGIIMLTLILKDIPVGKIKALGDFFKKVMPTIPITEIVKLWKKN